MPLSHVVGRESAIFFLPMTISFFTWLLERNGLRLRIYSKFISQALAKPLMSRKKMVFFRSNIVAYTKAKVLEATRGRIWNSQDCYHGLPALVGRSKYNCFHWIKEKVWQRVISWKKQAPLSSRMQGTHLGDPTRYLNLYNYFVSSPTKVMSRHCFLDVTILVGV